VKSNTVTNYLTMEKSKQIKIELDDVVKVNYAKYEEIVAEI